MDREDNRNLRRLIGLIDSGEDPSLYGFVPGRDYREGDGTNRVAVNLTPTLYHILHSIACIDGVSLPFALSGDFVPLETARAYL